MERKGEVCVELGARGRGDLAPARRRGTAADAEPSGCGAPAGMDGQD